jgi:arylformamidase
MNKRIIYDISLTLNSELPAWPGDSKTAIIRTESLTDGDAYNSSVITAPLHWGTHIDAPHHLYENRWSVDEIPLEVLVGSVTVIEIPNKNKITSKDLEKFNFVNVERLLFKTKNSILWNESPLKFHTDFCALTADAAEFILKTQIKLIGIDYLSLDLYPAEDLPVHKLLYDANIVAIEGLDLREIEAGYYTIYCLPIKILKGDGAPARVILVRE